MKVLCCRGMLAQRAATSTSCNSSSPHSRSSNNNNDKQQLDLTSVRVTASTSPQQHNPPMQQWQNRERLLALSEGKTTNQPKTTTPTKEGGRVRGRSRYVVHASSSTSALSPTPSSHVHSAPRMGLRVNDKKLGRHASACSSEQSLPERLSHALRALRPSALSHSSSSSSSPFKSKSSNFVVATDDLVYYPGAENPPNKRHSAVLNNLSNRCKGKVTLTKACPSQNDLHRINEMSSLQQIKQLYKSVPNISSIDQAQPAESPVRSTSRCKNLETSRLATNRTCDHRSTSPFLAKSPTDSGYRSAPRHLNQMPATNTVASVKQREHFLKSNSKHHEANESNGLRAAGVTMSDGNGASGGSGTQLHEPTVVLINGEVLETSYIPQMNNGFVVTSCASRASDPRNQRTDHDDYDYFTREASCSSAESTVATYDSVPVSIRTNESPFDAKDIINVLKRGRCKEYIHLINASVIPRLAVHLESPLRRLAVEIRRLSAPLTKCTPLDIKTAVKVVLSGAVADSCVKAAVQASSIYALSGTGALKVSMSRRAGLQLNLGRFYRWMVDNNVSRAVGDGAAVYLCAVIECLLEETVHGCITHRGGKEVLTAQSLDEIMQGKADICALLVSLERAQQSDSKLSTSRQQCSSCGATFCVRNTTDLNVVLQGLSTNSDRSSHQKNAKCSLTKDGLATLIYYTECRERCDRDTGTGACSTTQKTDRGVLAEDWYRIASAFASHRLSTLIDDDDVRQAARILLPNSDCPPQSICLHLRPSTIECEEQKDERSVKRDLGFRILMSGNSKMIDDAQSLLGPLKYRTVSEHGLSPLAEAVITGNDRATTLLLSVGADPSTPVPSETPSKSTASKILTAFAGWTPLTWAVAREDCQLVKRLVEACADVESSFMIHETPLQLAAMLNNLSLVVKLQNNGGNPFRTSISYDSLKCNFRNTGAPSALALAAARGNRQALRALIFAATNSKRVDEHISLRDFLEESDHARDANGTNSTEESSGHSSVFMDGFSKEQQRALHEALYYAAETGHLQIALDLRKIGVPWNVYTWATCLRLASDWKLRSIVSHLLGDFNSRLSDEISHDTIDDVVSELFEIVRVECMSSDGDPTPVAAIISRLFKQFRFGAPLDDTESRPARQSNGSIRASIDLKYVDNVQLSDIRFLVDKRIVFAHRIVLVNSSDIFKSLLDNPKGQIEIENVSYDVFKLLMQCLYSGDCQSTLESKPLTQKMELIEAARRYGVNNVIAESRATLRPHICRDTIVDIYKFATRCSLGPLIVDCELFLLERLSSLIHNPQLRLMLERSGRIGWPDYAAGLASRLVTAFQERCSRIAAK